MNTMMGSVGGTRGNSYGTTEREALLVDSNTRRRRDEESIIGNDASGASSSSSSSYFLNRKALALGALAFVSVGALVVAGGGRSSETSKSSFATLGGAVPHSFSELAKKKNLPKPASSSSLGLQKKHAHTAEVGLLGAMDIHAWPDPFEDEEAAAPVEEAAQPVPATEEPTQVEPAYAEIRAAEQVVEQPAAEEEAQPVPVQEEMQQSTNVLETANPQWVNQEAVAVQQQQAAMAAAAAQFGASGIVPEAGAEQAVAIDPQTGQPFATPADGGAAQAAVPQATNMDLSKPPASWPVDMESGVQCNPIIGCIAGVPYPGIGCCETATLTPADVAPTQQVPLNPYQYPIAGAVTTQPAAALPYQQQPQQNQQQQAQDPYAAYQQQLQAAPWTYNAAAAGTVAVAQPDAQVSPVGENGLPECNVADECVPGVPIPGIGCCNEAEKALIIADAQTKQQIDPVTGVPCNTDPNCVAGVPIPGIGCCESTQASVGTQEQQVQFYQQQQQIPGQYIGVPQAVDPSALPGAFAPGVNPIASAVITAENAQPQMVNQIDPVTGQACNPNPGCVAGVPIPGIGCCTGTASRMIPGAPLVDAATGLPLVNQNPIDPATGKPLFMKACDATPTCVAGVPTPGVDSCCKQGECDPSPTCIAGALEPGVNNCCHVCDPNPECQVGSEFPGIDTCCKPPPPPDYDGTPGNCDANPSCQPGVPDLGKNTCCPDNAACDTTPECIPGGTIPGVDTCCADTSLVKQKAKALGSSEEKKQNPWKGCNPDPKCLPGVDIPGVDNCCKNCEPGVPTPGVDDCAVARKRMWARSMRRNGMKNDQINEVIQKESKHAEESAEEKEQNRQQMMLELKNRIKEEMARKESLLKAKKSQSRSSARASRGSSSA